MVNVIECPTCSAQVIACDNSIYLDYPAVDFDKIKASWTLMNMGNQTWASNGDPSLDNKGHSLHEHQPEESQLNA